ncbi:MAG TPA: hypothetical protein V6C81_00885 [Planktothrix sp.]|jgi:hypothetical protein
MKNMAHAVVCSALIFCSQSAAFAVQPDNMGTGPAANSSPVTIDQNAAIERLTRNILLNEIKLEKFNLHFRIESAKQGRWKGLRFFSLQEINSGCTEGGLITGVAERGAHIHARQSRGLSENVITNGSNLPPGIGQVIGAGADGIELGLNGYHKLQASKHGFSAAQARTYVRDSLNNIDAEIAARDKLIEEHPDELTEMRKLESVVLNDHRNLPLAEFEDALLYARSRIAQQQAFYFLDIFKNATGASGNLMGFKALSDHRRYYNVSAGLLSTISGGLIMIDPILSRLCSSAVSKIQQRNLSKYQLNSLQVDTFRTEAHLNALREYCRSHKTSNDPRIASVLGRVWAYDETGQQFARHFDRNAQALIRGDRIAIQNMGSGLFVGASKIGTGVPLMIAASYERPVANSLIFAGNVSYLTGTTYSLLDNARIQYKREIDNHRLSAQHELPSQLVRARLARLEEMERKL